MKAFSNKNWLYGLAIVLLISCKKQDEFLDAKPNQALTVPSTLADLQLLLNNEGIFNTQGDPALGMLSTDEFYVTSSVWAAASTPTERNAYIFAKDIYQGSSSIGDWRAPYVQVYYANTVLDFLAKIKYNATQENQANQIKGTALFFRSYAFYNLLQTFSLPYDAGTAKTDLGIPLRLNPDLNEKTPRSSIQAGYDQLLGDLILASTLLPRATSYQTQPTVAAAQGLLARIYLAISDYDKARSAADECLTLSNQLVDYNTLVPQTYPISTTYLSEDIYHTSAYAYNLSGYTRPVVDSNLLRLYSPNDLRPGVFFIQSGGYSRFGGSYDFAGARFSGIATDEIYLIRAECYARAGNTADALKDLNLLLKTRWKIGTFVPLSATSADEALNLILTERKKELCFRGLRWTDLRRLNKDPRFALIVTHIINGVTYQLQPGDPKYAMPIPDQEIQLSGIAQNPR